MEKDKQTALWSDRSGDDLHTQGVTPVLPPADRETGNYPCKGGKRRRGGSRGFDETHRQRYTVVYFKWFPGSTGNMALGVTLDTISKKWP